MISTNFNEMIQKLLLTSDANTTTTSTSNQLGIKLHSQCESAHPEQLRRKGTMDMTPKLSPSFSVVHIERCSKATEGMTLLACTSEHMAGHEHVERIFANHASLIIVRRASFQEHSGSQRCFMTRCRSQQVRHFHMLPLAYSSSRRKSKAQSCSQSSCIRCLTWSHCRIGVVLFLVSRARVGIQCRLD